MQKIYYSLTLKWVICLLFSSCATDEVAIPRLTCTQPNFEVNKTIKDVQNASSSIPKQYLYDDVIEGYVVSSDEFGNFFKTISFQTMQTEKTPVQGFSVAVDATNSYIDFRVGNKIYVKLKNQFTDVFYGGLRIGSLSVNSYGEATVGRISQNDYKNILSASCTTVSENELVRLFTIEEVRKDENINTLVELRDVQFADVAIGRHYYEEANVVGGATNWSLRDKTGNQLIFRTSSYANFASSLVPEGSGLVRGILTKYGSDYQLIARSEADVKLIEKRAIAFFSEDFQTVENNVTINLPGWTNIAQEGTKFWKGVVYSGNGCAEFNILSTKNALNAAWLISPKINMDEYEDEILTFRTAQHDLDIDSPLNSLEVFIATDFDGLNVANATWKPLKVNLPTQATPPYEFVGSGAVDLSKYTGNIRIAFKYNGSGKDLALDGTFQIDDIQVFGRK